MQQEGGASRLPLQVRVRILQQAPLRRGSQVQLRLQATTSGEIGKRKPTCEARKGQQVLRGNLTVLSLSEISQL